MARLRASWRTSLPVVQQPRNPQSESIARTPYKTEQADDGADQSFGLAQSQAEHGLERQGRRDRQIRVVRLPARRGAWFGVPGCDRRLGEPDRQAPALAQGSIVRGPVRHPAPLFRNVVTAIGIGLERHGGDPGSQKGSSSYASHLQTPTTRSVQPTLTAVQALRSELASVGGALHTDHNSPPLLARE